MAGTQHTRESLKPTTTFLPTATTVVSLWVFWGEASSSARQLTGTLPVGRGSAGQGVPALTGDGWRSCPLNTPASTSPAADTRFCGRYHSGFELAATAGVMVAGTIPAATIVRASRLTTTHRLIATPSLRGYSPWGNPRLGHGCKHLGVGLCGFAHAPVGSVCQSRLAGAASWAGRPAMLPATRQRWQATGSVGWQTLEPTTYRYESVSTPRRGQPRRRELHRARLALAEPLRGELRRPPTRRAARRRGLQHPSGSPGLVEDWADRVQHRSTPHGPGISHPAPPYARASIQPVRFHL